MGMGKSPPGFSNEFAVNKILMRLARDLITYIPAVALTMLGACI
jgi:hypothetical protein